MYLVYKRPFHKVHLISETVSICKKIYNLKEVPQERRQCREFNLKPHYSETGLILFPFCIE